MTVNAERPTVHVGRSLRRAASLLALVAITFVGPGAALAAARQPAAADPVLAAVDRIIADPTARAALRPAGADPAITPEVVLAVAEAPQVDGEWSTRLALDAVAALQDEVGGDPVQAINAASRRAETPDEVARVLLRARAPLGLTATVSGAGDADARDLVAELASIDPATVSVTGLAEIALALNAYGATVPEPLVSELQERVRRDGGWSDLERRGSDPVATALVMDALVRAGIPRDGDLLVAARQMLLDAQLDDGSWEPIGVFNGETATASGVQGLRTVEVDCGLAVMTGIDRGREFLEGRQRPAGGFGAPGEGPLTTAAVVHALRGNWLPLSSEATNCDRDAADGGLDVPISLVVVGAIGLISVFGGVTIMRHD